MVTRDKKEKEILANKIFAGQTVLSEVVMELVKDRETQQLAFDLSGLNSKIDEIRKKLKG